MSIEAALLLVALTGGYFFASVCPPSAYVAARESGHDIYFRSVFYAVFLVICSVLYCVYRFLHLAVVASANQYFVIE